MAKRFIYTSMIKRIENILMKQGNTLFYRCTDNFYKRKHSLYRFINILAKCNMLNNEAVSQLENIDLHVFNDFIMAKIIDATPITLPMEIINDESSHISSLSASLSENTKTSEVADDFLAHAVECSSNDASWQIKKNILDFKCIHKDFNLFMGHFLEHIIGVLLQEFSTGEMLQHFSINNIVEKYADILDEVDPSITSNIDNAYALNALDATVHEVLSRNGYNECLDCFVSDILRNNDNVLQSFNNYVPILREQVRQMLEGIGFLGQPFTVILKQNLTHRSIIGESDFILVKDGYAVLVDCKVYANIERETMQKFLLQLIGYYQQHNILKHRPSYRRHNDFEVTDMMILNPLNAQMQFNYYLLNINEESERLDNIIEQWEEYIDKCLLAMKG